MSHQRPKVSIITPAYNAEKYIEKTIESIQSQTMNNYEHIIIDDGSSDRTFSIVKRYAKSDSRIRVIKQPASLGASAARNKGIEVSSGDYITFVDGDDFVVADMLEVLYNNATTYDNELICFNKFIYNDSTQEVLQEHWIYKINDLPAVFNPAKDISVYSFIFAPLNICAFLSRKFIEDSQLLFDSNYRRNEDVLFMTRAMALSKRTSYINRELYYYRVGMVDNMTSTLDKYRDDGWMVVADLYDFLTEKKLLKGNIKTSFNILCCSVLWHYIHNMKTYDGQKYAFEKTKKLAHRIGLDKLKNPGDIYTDINFYDDFQKILSGNYEQYLWNKIQRHLKYEADLIEKINFLDSEVTHRDVEINNLHNSLSWRATKVLRKVRDKVSHRKPES